MTPRRLGLAGACCALAAGLALPDAAFAHGLVGRADLPIPTWLFGWAAAMVLIVSFLALATLWRTPRLEGDRRLWPLPGGLSAIVLGLPAQAVAGTVGVALLAIVVWSGLAGVQSPQANLAPTFIYVIFWVGLVPVSALLGDVFRALNPWRAIGRAGGWTAFRLAGPMPAPFTYPAWLGRWPAAATLLGFTWMELAYTGGDDPSTLALAAVVYTAITLLAIACFGTEPWIRNGEGFSVYFNLFARMAPLAARDGRLVLRPPLAGLTRLDAGPGTVALLAVMIGSVTFDGASAGSAWTGIAPDIQDFFRSLGLGPSSSLELTFTVGMAMAILAVGAIYLIGVAGARTVDGRPFISLAWSYVHTLVPIAAVYVVAHYVSFLLYNGQAIGYLASDPLGHGWDLFGTADGAIDYSIITATGVWYVQVTVLVLGHVGGLVLAHDRALGLYKQPRAATQSQYWMLAVMVAFTTFGLWLLSQANA